MAPEKKIVENPPRTKRKGQSVCDEWLNFQNYAEWFITHYKEGFHVDKDLTDSTSRVYSPDTCHFIPQELNNLLNSSNKSRGSYPVGVLFHNKLGKFTAQMAKYSKTYHIGCFDTPEDAFAAYKSEKEAHVKKEAKMYYRKGAISEQIYNNLMEWEAVPYPE